MKIKHNNIFKISLLLLVSNLSNISASEPKTEMSACFTCQKYRNGSSGINLMVTGDEPLSGSLTCNSMYRGNIRQRAACIFGFNFKALGTICNRK